MIGARRVEPEWLDTLAKEEPEAVRSRRDLRRLNAWMFHAGVMRRLLVRFAGSTPPRTVVDLGAGDGTFLLALARRMAPAWRDVRAVLVDRQEVLAGRTREEFRTLGWRAEAETADVFDFLARSRPGAADLVIANLFLHHFAREQLIRLFEEVARVSPRFAACEPRRSRPALAGARAVWVLGCNRVTRHDAAASVRAGFRGGELSPLWPAGAGWHLCEYAALPFTHCFAACRSR